MSMQKFIHQQNLDLFKRDSRNRTPTRSEKYLRSSLRMSRRTNFRRKIEFQSRFDLPSSNRCWGLNTQTFRFDLNRDPIALGILPPDPHPKPNVKAPRSVSPY